MMDNVKEILIPIRAEELTIEKVEPYLRSIMKTFNANRSIIRKDYDYYCLDHKIANKIRPHEDEAAINNKIPEPHITAMVDWKVGYIFGNPIKYAQSKVEDTDDIVILNKYLKDSNKTSVDAEVARWVFATGVGYYFIEPRGDDYDKAYEAPFEIYCRDADSCCKVKSAYNGKKPLFDILYTEAKEIVNGYERKIGIVDIYLPNAFYEYTCNDQLGNFKLVRAEDRPVYTKLPLVEKKLHDYIGLSRLLRGILDGLDLISSNNLDNLQEVVNVIYKYYGIDMGDTPAAIADFHRNVRKNGAISLPQINPNLEKPDLTILKIDPLNLTDVQKFKDDLKRTAYEIAGVPLATSNTNSGGTTKSGSETANGYESAYNRAIDNITDFMPADRELLKDMLFICDNVPDNPINELRPSEIEIKYCINVTDNIQTKSQAYATLREHGVPAAMALGFTKLSSDPEADGKLIEENEKTAALQTEITSSIHDA